MDESFDEGVEIERTIGKRRKGLDGVLSGEICVVKYPRWRV